MVLQYFYGMPQTADSIQNLLKSSDVPHKGKPQKILLIRV